MIIVLNIYGSKSGWLSLSKKKKAKSGLSPFNYFISKTFKRRIFVNKTYIDGLRKHLA